MPENTDQPTQKAEKLYAKLILASCNEGDKIFDLFAGSGTTAMVAKNETPFLRGGNQQRILPMDLPNT